MKKLIFLVLIIPLISSSQITIQQSALPVVGNAWAAFNDNNPVSLSITPPGPTQNWNFSTGWLVGLPTIDNFISPSSLIGSSQFPSSNIALQNYSAGNTNNSFFRNDVSGLYGLGSYAFDTSFNIHKTFNSNFNILHVPFTYGNNFTDTIREESIDIFAPSLHQPAEKIIFIAIRNFTCDAWGTIKTPCYPNQADVIRIRAQDMGFIDSTFIDNTGTGAGPWTFSTAHSNLTPSPYVNWLYFQNSSPCIVMTISTDTNFIVNDASYYCDTLLNIIGCSPGIEINNIFPNPAAGEFIIIRIPGAGVKNIAIYNVSGSLVKELDASGISTINLSTEYFQNGIYFCVYLDGDKKKVYTEKFVVSK